MKPLLTPYLHKRRIEIIKPYLKGDILDIGCGSGDITKFLNKQQHYYGVELNEVLIEELKIKYPQYRFYCKNVDKEELGIDKKFDTILMIAVIEHLKNPDNILYQCINLLKKNGSLVMTTPTPLGDKIHKIGAKLGLTSKEAVKEHYKIYSYEDMNKLLSSYKFKIQKCQKFELGMNQMFVCKKVLK